MFYDRFKALCEERGVSCNKAAIEIGLSNATPTKWKKTDATPDGATLSRISDYFGVSIGFLLGTEQSETPALSQKDERDIGKRMEAILEDLESTQGGLMFSGEPLDSATKELLVSSLQNSMKMGKLMAKQKFTPKKYRKGKEGN